MSPRHFSKVMNSPYFQSHHYQTESKEAAMEKKIIGFVHKILRIVTFGKFPKKLVD